MRSIHLAVLRRAFSTVVVLDAVVGTIIAVGSVAHQFSAVPFPGMSRLQDMTSFMGFTFTNPGSVVLYVLPSFLSTLVLAPILLKMLQDDRPPLRHYGFGVVAGCFFGIAATAGTCFFLGAIAAFLPSPGTTIAARLAVLLAGPFFMAMAGGIAFSLLFWKEILVAGAAFGVFNAWLVRRVPSMALRP